MQFRHICLGHASDLLPIHLVMPEQTVIRTAGTCFRGRGKPPLAGNFRRWNNFGQLVDEMRGKIEGELIRSINDFLAEKKGRGFEESFTLQHAEFIGWDSTAPIDRFKPEELESFELNRRGAHGLRVTGNRVSAPLTDLVTLICQFSREGTSRWIVKVWSIYPGYDVGNLTGDVSRREGRAFFDWNHPGEVV